jgi:hypothetical protein
MDKGAVNRVCKQVTRSFPEMKKVRPSVKQAKGKGSSFVLTFKGKVDLPNGKTMNRVVRVTANERGAILRMSTSR